MSRFWLVRHGPTHAKTMVGWSDLPADLSDHSALKRLNAFLPAEALVVSSDLCRAVSTADALSGQALHRHRLPHDPALREMHFGSWELRSYAEIEACEPVQIRAFWESPGAQRAPGGESWDDLTCRVWSALDRLQDRAEDIIVVAHFGPILAGLQRALALPPLAVFAHRIDNLSVTCIGQIAKCGPQQVSRVNHLP